MENPGAELACHTYSHFYACEPGQTPEQFRADLQAAKKAAESVGGQLRSLVMPRNQVNPAYLPICQDEGFTSVRVNPKDWYWEIPPNVPVSLWKRLNRTADAYLPIGHRKSYSLERIQCNAEEPWLIPASRFLRPYRPWQGLANEIRLRRVLREMEVAAEKNEVYHLWWHPHNFGSHPKESMEGMVRILKHFNLLQGKYGMVSMNMGELTALLEQGK